jgi:DDE family transposase
VVSHLPPGTSKWNKIEHRLFSLHQPELARQAARQLPGYRRIDFGDHHQNRPHRALRTGHWPIPQGIVVSDAEMAAINIKRAEFHGEWNYTISPNTHPPNHALIS